MWVGSWLGAVRSHYGDPPFGCEALVLGEMGWSSTVVGPYSRMLGLGGKR